MTDALLRALADHDAAVARAGLDLWVGGEPTFTRAGATDPCWSTCAEGGDKEPAARAFVLAFADLLRSGAMGAAVLPAATCAIGRHYPEEPTPRFALGVAWRHDGSPCGIEDAMDGDPIPPPPSEPGLAWLTATPDPGVVEVNMAPCLNTVAFYRQVAAITRAAEDVGLTARRFRWNGDVSDSGGGGQLTFGGPSPAESPFFRHPALLPSLLRYLNHHPALSYAFGNDCVGSASQGPRPDEGSRERFEELGLALDALQSGPEATPDRLWSTLATLLVDGSGNAHRAEVNVEKLWNPLLLDRGKLGLVEFRALRMMPDPETQVAVAALFRACIARCAVAPIDGPLIDYGGALHDRFALPSFLDRDLRSVLADLRRHGFGLGDPLERRLLAEPEPLAVVDALGARMTLRRALEFWPLVDDVASQERAGARTVDASIRRIEIRIDGDSPGTIRVQGVLVPLTSVVPGLHVAGVRYRSFVPSPGFAADVPADDPLEIVWDRGGESRVVVLHSWRPGGGAYHALPGSEAEALARRQERAVVSTGQSPSHSPRPVPTRWVAFDPDGLGSARFVTVDVRGREPPERLRVSGA